MQSEGARLAPFLGEGGELGLKALSFQLATSMDLDWWTRKPSSWRRRSGRQYPHSMCVSLPQTSGPGEARLWPHTALQARQLGPNSAVRCWQGKVFTHAFLYTSVGVMCVHVHGSRCIYPSAFPPTDCGAGRGNAPSP